MKNIIIAKSSAPINIRRLTFDIGFNMMDVGLNDGAISTYLSRFTPARTMTVTGINALGFRFSRRLCSKMNGTA